VTGKAPSVVIEKPDKAAALKRVQEAKVKTDKEEK